MVATTAGAQTLNFVCCPVGFLLVSKVLAAEVILLHRLALRVNLGLRVAGIMLATHTATRRLDLHPQLLDGVDNHHQHTNLAQVQPHPHNITSQRGNAQGTSALLNR